MPDILTTAQSLCCDLITGAPAPWPAKNGNELASVLLEAAEAHGIDMLLDYTLQRHPDANTWPDNLKQQLKRRHFAYAAVEMLQNQELRRVLDRLEEAGVRPVLMKGTALAHSHYPVSSCRPRYDADLLLDINQLAESKKILAANGYAFPSTFMGEAVMSELSASYRLINDVFMNLDIHWKLYARPPCDNIFDYSEALRQSSGLQALGKNAYMLCPVHALAFACLHRALHLREQDSLRLAGKTLLQGNRLIWLYDIHLLLASMSPLEQREFVALAAEKQILNICREAIELSRRYFRTDISVDLREGLSVNIGAEPADIYLAGGSVSRLRKLLTEYRYLPDFSSRWRLLRGQLFPPAEYMLYTYRWGRPFLLPIMYAWRLFEKIPQLLRWRLE